MLKMIHADLYKTFHRAYFFIMTLVVSGLCVALVFAMRGGGAGNWTGATELGVELLGYPVFLIPMLTQIVYAEEFRDHTLKNTIAFGTNRTVLYISKWLTTIILGVIMAAVVLFFFFGCAALILPKDSDFTWDFMKVFFERFGASCLVYIAAISMSIFFIQLFNKSTLAIFFYYGGFYFTDLILTLIKCDKGIDYLLKTQMSAIISKPVDQFRDPIVITLVTMAVFFVAGIVFFRKKDFS
ncbi:MAG: ABC transporter permease [Thermocaproicibacter melissae]|jgi:ABC-2 type transport system permease protein|uniref:ABC transporter permease n=2 Tax=Thermocaproicibacter melissae TaxID=2966552 RepID=UPI0024B15981|nr:ABC transporter permease [Thermocaproicibacter melissae]WBY64895.1 ABC transporter permease [Thermocaproicibacter melissae]